ncbi:MAG: SCP-like extracellular protein [Chloroflexota bacterium]|nr:SCP-like extracellular protein [Chloroflexota bacterium]
MRSPARRFSPLALAFLLVIGLAPATASAGTPTDAQISAAEQSVLKLTNRRRANAGLVALRWDTRLAELAGDRAEYMARTGRFSHTQSGGTDVFDMIASAGIKWYGAGEIIAWNTAAALDYSAAFAVQGWMGSSSHKAIVMSKGYNYVGFGLAISDSGKRYWAGVYLKGPDRTGAWSRIVGTAKRNLNSTDVRVWVKWSGGDIRLQVLTSGFRYYQVQRSINGSAWSSYPITTNTTMTRIWRRNSTYDVRVRSRDRAGNWGAWKAITIKT